MHFTKYYKWVSFRLKQPLSSWVQKPLSTHSTDFQAYCTLPVIFETISSSAVTVSHISSTVVILATSPCFGLECSRRCSRALNTHTHTHTASTCRRPLNFAPTAAHTWRRWEIENVSCCGKSLQSWQIEIAVCCDDDVYEEYVTCCLSANNCNPQVREISICIITQCRGK